MDNIAPYIPIDRRLALANGRLLPQHTKGAALFVDTVGFTPLVRAFVQEFGRKQGAEEILNHINPMYDALIGELHRYGGSVIGFVGDAITCWLPEQDGAALAVERAVACGLAMQEAVQSFPTHHISAGMPLRLAVKVAIAAGPAHRFLVGDPAIKQIDTLAGAVLGRMADAEKMAQAGEVVVSEEVVQPTMHITAWREGKRGQVAVVHSLTTVVAPQPWAAVPPDAISPEQLEAWVLPQTYDGVQSDLRPIVPMMIRFGGIDFDNDADAGDKLDMFMRWAQVIIHQHGGTLLQLTIGDKGAFIYAPFGVPRAYEDSGRRAMAAALALQQPPAQLAWLPPLQIGISQGDVWTGLCGAAVRHTYAAIGREVNLAARLMAAAKAGQILTTGRIARLHRFRTERLGRKPYKGFADPIPTYLLLGKETAVKPIFAKLIGRESELQALTTFAAPLQDEKVAGMAFIYGEAGMGKSHLAYALQMETEKQVQWFTGQTDGILQRPFAPFLYWMHQQFHQFSDASEQENKTQFEQRLANLIDLLYDLADPVMPVKPLISELQRTRSVLGALLGLFWEGSLYDQLDAKLRRENTITAVKNLILAASVYQPTVLLIEDGQWLDAASRELLTAVSYDIADYPLLILLTSRYGDEGEKLGLMLNDDLPVCMVELEGLRKTAVFQQASSILHGDPAPDLLALLRQKTENNPFFVQQLLLHLQESHLLQQTGSRTWTLTNNIKRTGGLLPPTIDELLIARLDRLTQEVKGTVQTAAVLGHQFETRLLAEMLQHDLFAELDAAEKAQIWTLLNKLEYIFKHALLRDAAYDMQLRAQLRDLHYLAATTGEMLYADNLPAYYGALAYHYEAAYRLGQKQAREKARHYLYHAGQQAASAYDNDNAITYFNRALALTIIIDKANQYKTVLARERIYNVLGERELQEVDLDRLTVLAETIEEKTAVSLQYSNYHNEVANYEAALSIAAQAHQWAMESGDVAKQAQAMINSGRAYVRQGEYDAAREQYERAYELSEASKSPVQTARAWDGLGAIATGKSVYKTAVTYHQKALRLRQESDDQQGQVESFYSLGQAAFFQSEYTIAREQYSQAMELVRQIGDRAYEGRLLTDLASCDWRQGNYQQAEVYLQQSLAIAQTTGDKAAMMAALNELGIVVAMGQGQLGKAEGYFEQALAISQEIDSLSDEHVALSSLGNIAGLRSQYSKAITYMEQSLVISQELGSRIGEAVSLNNLGCIASDQGQLDKAITYYERCINISQEIGNKAGEGIALNQLGYAFALQGKYDQAKIKYEESLLIAREIGARGDEWDILNNVGASALMEGAFSQAQIAYQQAVDIGQELDLEGSLIDSQIGLALIALQQGDLETAQTYANQLQTALADDFSFDDAEHPVQTIHFVWQLYKGLGMVEQANKLLATAAAMMQTCVDNEPDPDLQENYLQQPHQRPLWEAWQNHQSSHPTRINAQIAQTWSGLGEVAYSQGEYATATQYHEKVLIWHREMDDLSGQIGSLRNLGKVANAQGNHKVAHDYFLEALELAQQTGNRPSEGRLLFELGTTVQQQRNYPQATAYFEQALALAQASNDKNNVTDILQSMAIVARHLGQYRQAMVHLEECLTIRKNIGDRDGVGSTLNIMGAVAYYQGKYNQAAEYWEQSLIIAQEVGDQAGIGTRSNNLGGIFFSQGQYEKAAHYWEQSLSIAQSIGRRMGECITLYNLGGIFCNQGRYDKAAIYYEQSLTIAQDIESSLMIMLTFTAMGTLALAQSALAQAKTAYVQALDVYEKADKLPLPLECWAGLALIALRQNDRETAQQYADKVLTALDDKVITERGEDLVKTFYLAWQLYQGLGMGEADEVLTDAAKVMQMYLDKQSDTALQAIYLQQPYHRPLWEAWETINN